LGQGGLPASGIEGTLPGVVPGLAESCFVLGIGHQDVPNLILGVSVGASWKVLFDFFSTLNTE